MSPLQAFSSYIISIHSTTRVETLPWHADMMPAAISIHSTTRVETNALPLFVRNIHYFNPLHHEGGDLHELAECFEMSISIHSTTRVETHVLHVRPPKCTISIHSTTRVETVQTNGCP